MFKRGFALLALFLLAANLFAGDPWKDKPYKQWDEKDIRKIMTESPWVKGVSVEKTWGGVGLAATAPTLGASGSAASSEPRDVARGATPSTEERPQAVFVFRWASSRTIRRALARRALLLRGIPGADAEQFLAQEPVEYQVVVLGADMTLFAKADEKESKAMREKSYLASRKSKTRLAPDRIEIERTPDGKNVLAVHFYFAKKTAAGEPALSPKDKGAEFVCQIGGITMKANFDFQKLVDSQGVDL